MHSLVLLKGGAFSAVAVVMTVSAFAGLGPAAKIDFSEKTGKVDKWMHCASWAIRSNPYGLVNDTEAIKSLNLTAFRTHDAPLVNRGQEIIDTHCIFPLMHLYMRDILHACRKAGVRPDFMSWHHYGDKPDVLLSEPAKVKKLCEAEGFRDMELVINEYADKVKCEKTWPSVYPFAALSADGRKAIAIVTDYRGTQQILNVGVKGLENVKRISARVLDNTHDLLPTEVEFRDGVLTLVKNDRRSAVFAVVFER